LNATKKELKAPLRNFTFLPAADRELVRLKVVTGKNMTAVLEDLILGRRQFGEQIERFLDGEMARTGKSRPRNHRTGRSAFLYRRHRPSGPGGGQRTSPCRGSGRKEAPYQTGGRARGKGESSGNRLRAPGFATHRSASSFKTIGSDEKTAAFKTIKLA